MSTENSPEKSLENISDTARWVAVYRAVESERPDALFNDPFARVLAGERGENIVRTIPGGRTLVGWTVVVRTRVIDDTIMAAVRDHGIDGVLNLAAGLDTRPYRLPLPKGLKWYEVDLPEIFAYKEAKLASHAPVCRLSRLTVDLSNAAARRELFDRVGTDCKKVLVLTEGILMYLTVEQVDALAHELAARPAFAIWVQDYVAKLALQAFNLVWAGTLGRAGSRFRFLQNEGRAFFRNRGWKEREFRPLVVDAEQLNRKLPLGALARFVARVSPFGLSRGSSGILVLERPS